MMWREVVVRIEASVPEGRDEQAWRSELNQAIEDAELAVANWTNWAEVKENGIRVKVSTP